MGRAAIVPATVLTLLLAGRPAVTEVTYRRLEPGRSPA